MDEYDRRRDAFDWDEYWDACDWAARDELNVAHEVIDAHVEDDTKTAMRWLDSDGRRDSLSYGEFARRSNRFANVIRNLELAPGDRVITYLPRIPEHYTVLLGTLKAGGVFGAINERYGVEGIEHRLGDSNATVVVTTASNREMIDEALENTQSVHQIVVGGTTADWVIDYDRRMDAADDTFRTIPMAPDDPAFLYYTSGTTGPAKGVVHGHRLIVNIAAMCEAPIGLRDGDLFWCTADLGWLTGLIPFGALFHGVPIVVYDGEFDVRTWVDILDEYPISVLFSVPTAFRLLKDGDGRFEGTDLSLRTALSVGEPLNPAVVRWARERFGTPILDNYGTSEAFGGVVTNFSFDSWEVKPGSMGKPNLGVEVTLVDHEDGTPVDTGEIGEIAVADYPGRFLCYWERPTQTDSAIQNGLLRTGDLARRDEDGYFWFEGRADDVILSSGYRIGPFDIESTLVDHDAVAEAAAVPTPDETKGNEVKAIVVLSAGTEPSASLRDDIKSFAEHRLAAHEYPRVVEFVDDLPKTVTGKIRRRALRD